FRRHFIYFLRVYRFNANVNTPAVTSPKPIHSCVFGRSSKKTTAIRNANRRCLQHPARIFIVD
ncbi:hypothetical protein BBZ81_09830, partial [Neisseria gonorrhoeae]|uniref:hypothetical protein n=1 Tax=Neisseria gonorrhoeae TaxID=485 RepID=UPI0008DD6504